MLYENEHLTTVLYLHWSMGYLEQPTTIRFNHIVHTMDFATPSLDESIHDGHAANYARLLFL